MGGKLTRRILLATVIAIFASAPASAAAATAWEIETTWAPSHLPPGSSSFFYAGAVNVGDTASGLVTLTTELPPGVTTTSASANINGTPSGWSCNVTTVAATTSTPEHERVTCSRTGSVAGGGNRIVAAKIAVDVAPDPGTSGPFEVSATINGGSATATVTEHGTISADAPGFGILSGSLDLPLVRANGDPANQAGEHPDSFSTNFDFNLTLDQDNEPMVDEQVSEVHADLPPGFVGDPTAVPRCGFQQLIDGGIFGCPNSTQVGFVSLIPSNAGLRPSHVPVYNMVPPPGLPALFAFNTQLGPTVTMEPELRSDGDYGITVSSRSVNQLIDLAGVRVTFWGVPADPSHDVDRGVHPDTGQSCLLVVDPACANAAETPRVPFLTNPTDCSVGPMRTHIRVKSWRDSSDSGFFDNPAMTGCENLPFDPSIKVQPTSTQADSPTGLDVEVRIPQNENPDGLASAHLEKAVVTLPEGMTVNPSSANGLAACSPAQIGLDSRADPTCPEASKIGSVEVDTPLLDETLHGSVFVAKQNDNPFNSLLAIYIVAKGPGIIVKLPGHVDPDPVTGRLTTTFDNNPQLPFTSFRVRFKGGPRAPLANPPTCGSKVVESALTPYSAYPEPPAARVADPAKVAHPSDAFDIPCPVIRGFAPDFSAGTANPTAGAFSPFVLRINRDDGEQYMRGLTLEMPTGLIANVRGIPLCPDAQANAGSCDPASKVGTSVVGSGAGSQPFFTAPEHGSVYLTEGYKGAPFGLSTVVRAIAGPYDLGTVVVRQAIHVDRTDAHVTVVSDPIPIILEGIPLRVRSINVDVNRPGFMINPTSCAEKQIKLTLTSVEGTVHETTDRFQAADCASLALKPKLRMRLTGRKQLTDGKHPGLRSVLTQGPGQANMRSATVRLPLSLALDPLNAQSDDLCEFEAGQRVDCPPSSIVGHAVAHTPVLNRPLEGPVHFVKNVRVHPRTGRLIRTLPTLLIPLRGEVALDVRATTNVIDNKLVSTFPTIPDAPVSRFELDLEGGADGILVAVRNICRRPRGQIADAEIDGHNGKRADQAVRLGTPCAKKKRKAALRVAKASWQGNRVTVSGRINRMAKRHVKVTVRCGRASLSRSAKPNRRGLWRATFATRGRCTDVRRARVVARYAGDRRVARSRAARSIRVPR